MASEFVCLTVPIVAFFAIDCKQRYLSICAGVKNLTDFYGILKIINYPAIFLAFWVYML
jgi:hypothetical protein